MKFLVLCLNPNFNEPDSIINNLSTIYAYHFTNALKKYNDVEIDIKNFMMNVKEAENLDTYDFCFVANTMGVIRLSNSIYNIIRQKIKYKIITLCEKNGHIGKEDLLLYIIGSPKPKTLQTKWGCNSQMLVPKKTGTITVLVDHKYYGNPKSKIAITDQTENIIASLLKYKENGNNIIIKHINNGFINEVKDSNYNITKFVRNTAIDFRKMYEIYNEADIFVVTHNESFGFSIVECACAGALIVAPKGFVSSRLLKTIHHVVVPDFIKVDWQKIIAKININKSVNKAKIYDYKYAANEIYKYAKTHYMPTDISSKNDEIKINDNKK